MQQDFEYNELKKIPLFSELNIDDLKELLTASSMHHFPKGTLIFQERDEYRGFYIVLEGKVKVYKLHEDGKETILHLFSAMNTLAEVPMFLGGGYPAHAETIVESTLLLIHKDGFLGRLYMYPDLAVKMLAGLSKRLKVLGDKIENLTALDIKTRLVRYLLDEYAKQKDQSLVPVVVLPISKSLLAAQIGTIIETLSRAFKKLQEDALIRVRGNKIFLDDLETLKKIAHT